MHNAASAGGLIDALSASFAHPQSKFHGDRIVLETATSTPGAGA
jgi:hypothetical protein